MVSTCGLIKVTIASEARSPKRRGAFIHRMATATPVISFRHGDHTCHFYRDPQEQMGGAPPNHLYLSEGDSIEMRGSTSLIRR